MSTHYKYCPNPDYGMMNCDLSGPREEMCETCLTHVVRSERPSAWSPVVKKPTSIISVEEGGVIQLPEDVIAGLNLKPTDTLLWEVGADGSVVVTKKEEKKDVPAPEP